MLVVATPAFRGAAMAVWGGFVPVGFACADFLASLMLPGSPQGFLLTITLGFALFATPAALLLARIPAVEPPPSEKGWFVKPNRLGAKIGIWEDSRCASLESALGLSRRVFSAYRDDVIVQPYLEGRNVRASFLAVDPTAGAKALGVVFVDSGSDFQTMDQSLRSMASRGRRRGL